MILSRSRIAGTAAPSQDPCARRAGRSPVSSGPPPVWRMRERPMQRIHALALLALSLVPTAAAQIEPDAVLLRFPDVSATHIVFRYDGDLWLVEKEGGEARRLTSAAGNESFPRFSPDGTRVAFVGGYDGGSDLYVMDLAAGVPQRVTYHPAGEILCDWTPDGGLVYWSSEVSGLARAPRLFTVGAAGGQPSPLPVPYGTFGALDATGRWLAYTPVSREFRTWKRYRGGMASDIWLFDLQAGDARRMTDHAGSDDLPMWHGREVVFLSDRGPGGRLNLYAEDVDSGSVRALTDFTDVDVHFPSIGPEDVVFEADAKLWRHVFATGENVPVRVRIPGDRPDLRPQTHAVASLLAAASPGPGGKRVALEARGEIFSVPVEEGVTRSLTRTDGVAERDPAWSPDARWIAYFSDRSGEYELTLRRADGSAFDGSDENGERRLTQLGPGWKSELAWSPDSKTLSFSTNDGAIHLVDVASATERTIHANPQGEPLAARWSRDSGWLCWSHRHSSSRLSAIYLYDVRAGVLHEVTSGRYDDVNPVFDRAGDWLFYASSRTFEPIYEDLGDTWIYANSRRLLAMPLRADVENPWAVEDEQEEVEGEDAAKEGEEKDENAEPDEKASASGDEEGDAEKEGTEEEDEKEEKDEEPLVIEIEGLEARALQLPVEAGNLGNLEGGDGKLLFVRRPRTGAEGEGAQLLYYDLEEKEEKTVLESFTGSYVPAAKGEAILVSTEAGLAMVKLAPDQKPEPIDLAGLVVEIDPRDEWKQLLADVHRLYRDFFYDPHMHGVDWDAVCERYSRALADATSRADVHWMIGEMIAELNVGHAYNPPPPEGLESAGPARPVGLLGCDWSLEQGAYRIARILDAGEPADVERSPLARFGVDAREGDWLLAVNGAPVDASRAVYAAFLGTAGRPTELTVCASPLADGSERRVLVEPLESETALRYRDWVTRKRAEVDAKSGGRVGYVHVPSTGLDGQNELFSQFVAQRHKDALLVDERWNSGGQIPTRFIELLDRPVTNYWAVRHGEDWQWPPVVHAGPKAMLINGWAGSGGDAFPYYFRAAGLGKLIGRRTWGGLVGLSGNPGLIDGATPTVPRFAFYELDGTWGVEGHGVDPDIEVMDDPALMVDGGDPQLDAAIAHLVEELRLHPPRRPARPAGPDRSRSGVTDADR